MTQFFAGLSGYNCTKHFYLTFLNVLKGMNIELHFSFEKKKITMLFFLQKCFNSFLPGPGSGWSS